MSASQSAVAAAATSYAGTVAWFNTEKGWGFISRDDLPEGAKGRDVFVHYSGIEKIAGKRRRNIDKGDRVAFEIIDIKGRPQAINVSVTQKAELGAAAE